MRNHLLMRIHVPKADCRLSRHVCALTTSIPSDRAFIHGDELAEASPSAGIWT